MYYIAIADTVNKRKLVPASDDIHKYVTPDRDFYKSVFLYTEDHYNLFRKTKSLAGIRDVVTDILLWDFDKADNLEQARTDAKELCNRLLSHGIAQDNIQIAFSGCKGFSIEIATDTFFTPEDFANVNMALAQGLLTNDTKIFDAARIIRIVGTKHNTSGLYKFPLTLNQLNEMHSEDIKGLAADINNAPDVQWGVSPMPKSILNMRNSKVQQPKIEQKPPTDPYATDIDFRSKPKWLSNCKYAIMNGFFEEGERSHALMALAATCRAQGLGKETTYGILKSSARLMANRTNTEPFPKEQLWNTIIEQVYGPMWKGAQYTCKNQTWLKDICVRLGEHKCKHTDTDTDKFIEVVDISKQFEDYSLNIEKNTIKTGLDQLDKNIQLTIGMPVALLGAPSSGKTSLALNILSNTSQAGISSVFFSMDMYGPLVYMKQIQKRTGYTTAQIHNIFKHDPKEREIIKEAVKQEYKNVRFSLKAGHTVQEMRDIIAEYQDKTGDKVKLVLVDYLECISGPYSDPTANSAKIAGELRDFATEMSICGITLVQPPKSAGDASYPLTSMRQIKGSSVLEQSFRAILGIYREGFGPNNVDDDKFITINALKNTMGPLFSIDNYWNGRTCTIQELDENGEIDLQELRRRKAAQAKDKEY